MCDSGIEVTPLGREHLPSLHEGLDSVARERVYLAITEAPSQEILTDLAMSHIERGLPQYVAVAGGNRVVGWCGVSRFREEGFDHGGKLFVGVCRDFRGRGLGRKLMVVTLEKAREIGLERVELEVYASNYAAIGLYERLGFTQEGTKRKARKLDGRYEDLVIMGLLLDDVRPA